MECNRSVPNLHLKAALQATETMPSMLEGMWEHVQSRTIVGFKTGSAGQTERVSYN